MAETAHGADEEAQWSALFFDKTERSRQGGNIFQGRVFYEFFYGLKRYSGTIVLSN